MGDKWSTLGDKRPDLGIYRRDVAAYSPIVGDKRRRMGIYSQHVSAYRPRATATCLQCSTDIFNMGDKWALLGDKRL